MDVEITTSDPDVLEGMLGEVREALEALGLFVGTITVIGRPA